MTGCWMGKDGRVLDSSSGTSTSDTSSEVSMEEEDLVRSITDQVCTEDEERFQVQTDPNQFTFRPIQRGDRDRVKQLHEDWFPVTYHDEFYQDLAEGHLAGIPLFTRLAIYNNSDDHSNELQLDELTFSRKHCSSTTTLGDSGIKVNPFTGSADLFSTTFGLDEEIGSADFGVHGDDSPIQPLDYNCDDDILFSNKTQEEEEEIIAGCVVGSFVPVTHLSSQMQNLLVSNPLTHPRLFYIMTLGTVTEFRHAGLGTRLVQECIDQVEREPQCGTLYLHVITHNQGAIRLYEKLGFYRVEEIPDYYDIRGQKYPCFLYAKYFHGNTGHLDVYKRIAKLVWAFFRQVLDLANISPRLILGSTSSDADL